jgi:AraC-like DNA-binding protein
MFIHFDSERLSDSPFIERVWSCHSEGGGRFLAVASSHWEMVVTRLHGLTSVTIHGPETRAREVECPADGEWFAIRFKAGTFMPNLPVHRLINGNDVNLAPAFRNRFRLEGTAWQIPDAGNAEEFVRRLARRGLLIRDAAVVGALEGDAGALHARTTQRHFLYATGMSQSTMRQIERARQATQLLREGLAPGEVAAETGYFDQAHLTRSLRALIGLTPAHIRRGDRQLSYLYKT